MNQVNQLYLGRLVNAQNQPVNQEVSYALEHLTTHALLLGATGSGKTGLGLVMVEEVLRQGIPVLLLDVKGDLSNLLLTFPELDTEDFIPWIDSDAARREGQTPEQAAAETAQRWRAGLTSWNLAPGDIADLRRRADLALYTPGSRAGQPVDILARFGAPPSDNPDEAALRAQGLASALLGLAGENADPIRSREHILLTTIIRHAWESAGTLDVPTLIQHVQNPPMERVGVFDLESFFPAKDRFELALALNNLIAAPGFARWREGEALDIDHFLYTEAGQPRATVFYMAHLPEEQRHFFVTLFLEEMRSWVRSQAGTRTLRALLYFDEIYGYLPPHPYNPPPKAPLMALLKQGRAAGLGVALSTQNPGDLDYKALSNIGTWCVGALRTDRDKRRVLEGMEGAIAEAGLHIPDIENAISRLKPRVFLMHNTRAREDGLRFFHSRWAMSYLRGPLTIAEVQNLTKPATSSPSDTPFRVVNPESPAAPSPNTPSPIPAPQTPLPDHRATTAPVVDPVIPQAFLPPTITAAWAIHNHEAPLPDDAQATLIYLPHLLGAGVAHIYDDRAGVSLSDTQVWRIALYQESWNLRWEQGEMINLNLDDLSPDPPREGVFEELARSIGTKSAQAKRESTFKTQIYRKSVITLWACKALNLYSQPTESKGTFLERCRQEMEKQKQEELAQERQSFEQKMSRILAKARKEELELQQDEEELSERKREELLSGAESVLSLFSRRRKSSRALSRASRQHRYVQQAKADMEESVETLKLYEEEQQQLEASWQSTAQNIAKKWETALSEVEEYIVRAKRADVEIHFCGLAWFPFWEIRTNEKPVLISAYLPQ